MGRWTVNQEENSRARSPSLLSAEGFTAAVHKGRAFTHNHIAVPFAAFVAFVLAGLNEGPLTPLAL